MRQLVASAGLAGEIAVDSAGTGPWHVGEPADLRAVAAAWARGYLLDGVARQVRVADFAEFDLLVGMDRHNLRSLRDLAPDRDAREKIRLLLGGEDVPDPYSGGPAGFELVLDLVEGGCRDLLAEVSG